MWWSYLFTNKFFFNPNSQDNIVQVHLIECIVDLQFSAWHMKLRRNSRWFKGGSVSEEFLCEFPRVMQIANLSDYVLLNRFISSWISINWKIEVGPAVINFNIQSMFYSYFLHEFYTNKEQHSLKTNAWEREKRERKERKEREIWSLT